MFENITKFFKKITKKQNTSSSSKDTAKERLHLVLMQDRANVSADFLDLMRQEIIDVIKKYIEVDESAIDVRLTNKENEDGTNGAPALYANIPILNIKEEAKKEEGKLAKERKNTESAKKDDFGVETFGDTSKNFLINEDTSKDSNEKVSEEENSAEDKKLEAIEDNEFSKKQDEKEPNNEEEKKEE